MNTQDIIKRNNIQMTGKGEQTLLMAHGFGCDQKMWRFVLPLIEQDYRLVLFDYVGSGGSVISAYDADRYTSLEGYAQDIIEICETLDLKDVSIVGHSVSGIISLIAAQVIPQRIKSLVMVCPSPYFMNDPPHYAGGFEHEDLEDLLSLMDSNFIGWANYLSPLVIGQNNPGELIAELADSFCSTDPVIAKSFARATFFSDYRWLLPKNVHPALLIQSRWDSLASMEVTQYMQKLMPYAEVEVIEAEGHCPHMSHPAMIANVMHGFLNKMNPS